MKVSSMKLNKPHICSILYSQPVCASGGVDVEKMTLLSAVTAPPLFIHQISFRKKPVCGEDIMHAWTLTLQESVRLVILPRPEQ